MWRSNRGQPVGGEARTRREARTDDGLFYRLVVDGTKPWLALTHGAFCSLEDWNPFVEALSAAHNLLMWDLPGHGRSRDAPLIRSLPHGAEALARVMEAAGVGRATQLGCSFGGMIAQSFARTFPERTGALIGYACVPITAIHIPAPALVRTIIRLQFLLTARRRFADKFAQQASIDRNVQDALRASVLGSQRGLAPAIWTAMTDGVIFEPDYRYSCPVALITGQEDTRFPNARPMMEAWGRALPPGRWIDIAGAGHVPHLERPAAFMAALGKVLDAVGNTASRDELHS